VIKSCREKDESIEGHDQVLNNSYSFFICTSLSVSPFGETENNTLFVVICDVCDQEFVSVPGNIPSGYMYEAGKRSSETHKIPVPPEKFEGETDYAKILLTIKRFLMVSIEWNLLDILLNSFKICNSCGV
jgi:hypothetical protein